METGVILELGSQSNWPPSDFPLSHSSLPSDLSINHPFSSSIGLHAHPLLSAPESSRVHCGMSFFHCSQSGVGHHIFSSNCCCCFSQVAMFGSNVLVHFFRFTFCCLLVMLSSEPLFHSSLSCGHGCCHCCFFIQLFVCGFNAILSLSR